MIARSTGEDWCAAGGGRQRERRGDDAGRGGEKTTTHGAPSVVLERDARRLARAGGSDVAKLWRRCRKAVKSLDSVCAMRVAVIGGTGGLGRLVAAGLAARGDEVRVVSRHAPESPLADGIEHQRADLASGEGLAEAVAGMEVVVNSVNELRRARAVLVGGTRRLLDAEAAAGVGHHVAISIVGCERVPWSYYDAKAAQEDVVAAGPVGWSLLRATQFHTLLAGTFAEAARWRLVPTGRALLQPIDPALVAERLVAVVHAGPAGRLPDLAGPEVRTLTELAGAWRAHHGRRLLALRVPFVGRVGRALRAGGLTDPAAAAGGPAFAQWLEAAR